MNGFGPGDFYSTARRSRPRIPAGAWAALLLGALLILAGAWADSDARAEYEAQRIAEIEVRKLKELGVDVEQAAARKPKKKQECWEMA